MNRTVLDTVLDAPAVREHGPFGGYVVITPRFQASRHVVVLVLRRASPEPALVLKFPRLASDRAGIEHEAAVLDALATGLADGASVPRRVATLALAGRPVLVQTAVVGTPIDRRVARRRPAAVVAMAQAWLEQLPVTDATVAPTDWFERLVDEPLGWFAALVGDPAVDRLVDRTRVLLAPLRTARIPLVFEHGDLRPPNLLRRADGRLGVVDWESAEPHGLPGHDLCFLLSYVVESWGRRRPSRDRDAMLRGPGSWGGRIVSSELRRLGIAQELRPHLVLATRARSAVELLARGVSPTAAGALDAHRRRWILGSEALQVWSRMVADPVPAARGGQAAAGAR